MKVSTVRIMTIALAIMALMAFAPTASATPSGSLNLTNCSGGNVIVTATSIDWTLPVGPPNGCIITGSGTSVVTSAGTLGPSVTGSILDLTTSTPLPLSAFMTFTGFPALHFDLSGIGPGPSSTLCSAALDPNAPACAVFAGSPFILQSTSTGTSVTLSAHGNVSDATGTSTWAGAYTTQIAGLTPAQIQTTILAQGSESSTYSGSFVLTIGPTVPEPSTAFLGLSGLLIGAGLYRRRRRS